MIQHQTPQESSSHLPHRIRVLMLRSFGFRLSLWSAQRVRQPVSTPKVWLWHNQLYAHVFVGLSRARGYCARNGDRPLRVLVSVAELREIAQSKACWLPGVNFNRKDRAWRAYWQENQEKKVANRGIGKLEKKGMTENAASLAALRAAIATRNVVANVKEEKLHFLEGDLQGMVNRR